MRGVPRLRPAMIARRLALQRHVEQSGRARDDDGQLLRVVEVELADEAEPVAQGRGHQAGARGRAHQREVRQVQADRARRGSATDHDVEAPVLHRRVQDLLDAARESVDLVHEEHVAVLEVGQQRRQVAGARQHRTGRDAKTGPHLGRDDAGERGLAQSRRSGEQEVVGGLVARPGRAEHDLEVSHQLALPDELGQGARSERDLGAAVLFVGDRRDHVARQLLDVDLVAAHWRLSSCRAWRSATPSSCDSVVPLRAWRTSWVL